MKAKEIKKPIDKFNDWVTNHFDEIDTMARMLRDESHIPRRSDKTDKWLRREIAGMRSWLIGNTESGRANKKYWGRFMSNWLSKAVNNIPPDDWRPYPNYMTKQEEDSYYEHKKRVDGGGCVSIGEILNRAKEELSDDK